MPYLPILRIVYKIWEIASTEEQNRFSGESQKKMFRKKGLGIDVFVITQ